MPRCGHTEPELSCPICTSREDLIAKVTELRTVANRLAKDERFTTHGSPFPDTSWTAENWKSEVRAIIEYAKQHAEK